MKKHCEPCEGKTKALTKEEAHALLKEIPNWQLDGEAKTIFRDFKFKNFHDTMHFVNKIAAMANHENHHPDLEVGYSHCLVKYRTHSIQGLSENDFICAKQVDMLGLPSSKSS